MAMPSTTCFNTITQAICTSERMVKKSDIKFCPSLLCERFQRYKNFPWEVIQLFYSLPQEEILMDGLLEQKLDRCCKQSEYNKLFYIY